MFTSAKAIGWLLIYKMANCPSVCAANTTITVTYFAFKKKGIVNITTKFTAIIGVGK